MSYFCAKWVFTVAPIICCGDLQLDRCGISSGYRFSTRFTQPGQQDVNCGMTPPVLTRFRNSVVSSMIVRSAAKEKSKMRSKPIARIRPATNGDASSGDLPYCAASTLRGAGATKPDHHLGGVVDRGEHRRTLPHVVEGAAGAGVTHWPQETQSVSMSGRPSLVPTVRWPLRNW